MDGADKKNRITIKILFWRHIRPEKLKDFLTHRVDKI
jgi:hypothetical protein